jgi:NTE family protein
LSPWLPQIDTTQWLVFLAQRGRLTAVCWSGLLIRRVSAMVDDRVYTAIVLQGGGALGAYEYGVLKALYEQRPGFTPVAVAGISIGAINAAVLGGAKTDPVDALDALWRDRLTVATPWSRWLPGWLDSSCALMGNPGMYLINPELFVSPWTSTSLYNTAPLRRTLEDLVDPVTLNDEGTRVIVGAIGVGTGEIDFFDRDHPGGLTLDHVVASGSLPPTFPMTSVNQQWYWDGGLFANTPLGPAINALERAAGGALDVVRELIVVELFPMKGAVPSNLLQVHQRSRHLQYTSRMNLDHKFFEKMNGVVDVISEIDDAIGDHAIRNHPVYAQLREHRKVNHYNVVTAALSPELGNAGDFSDSAIQARIEAGYRDALNQGIGQVDSTGLRPGILKASG